MQDITLALADKAGVDVRVSFEAKAPLVLGTMTKAAGWVDCPQKPPVVIHYYAPYLDDALPLFGETYFEKLAAHEVCHVINEDFKKPCSLFGYDEREVRANTCADALLRR